MANYVEGRNIYFSGTVNEDNISWLIFELQKIENEDNKKEKELKEYKREPVTLHIMSFGGCVVHGLNAYDVIKNCKTDVNTICLTAMSMGFIMFLAGKSRKMYKNSTLMNHSLSGFQYDKLQGLQDDVEDAKIQQQIMNDIIVENTLITRDKQEEIVKMKKDWYIRAKEAKELGIIDEIL